MSSAVWFHASGVERICHGYTDLVAIDDKLSVISNQFKTLSSSINIIRQNFCQSTLYTYFCRGEMAERSNAAVLKTVDCYRSGGSNPSLSAESCKSNIYGFFYAVYVCILKIEVTKERCVGSGEYMLDGGLKPHNAGRPLR